MTRVTAKANVFEEAALVDVLVDAIRKQCGEDYVVLDIDARRFCEPVLILRGDKIPKSLEQF